MLENIQVKSILFIDIECVRAYASIDSLDDRIRKHWHKKCQILFRRGQTDPLDDQQVRDLYDDKAAIYAEFGKIICISIGYIHPSSGEFRIKSFAHHDEAILLQEFTALINRHYYDADEHFICGHNIKEFDIPYICRRLLIHNIKPPAILNLAGKKPWETKHLVDTMDLWKFGDYKNYTSLDLLAAVLDIETPKDDIDGSMVGEVYWEQDDLARITHYCEKDVLTVAQVLLRLKNQELIDPSMVVSVT